MLVAKLLTVMIFVLVIAAAKKSGKKSYPPGSPKGPDYCKEGKKGNKFPCRHPEANSQHIFCNCDKYKCHDFMHKANMTQYRAFGMYWHNHWRNLVATGTEPEMLGAGKPFPPAADMSALSYNYAMEDGARCHAKKCADPLQHDSCHLTPLYDTHGGGGQNAMKGKPKNLECRWSTGPVKGCDVNTMNKYETLAYCAIRKWYEEFKDLTNASIIDIAYYDAPVKPADYKKTGHMTAMLWAKTYDLGCGGSADKAEKRFYYTCNYWEHGNTQNMPVYTIGKGATACPPNRPAHQVPEFEGLCGPSILPPAPPDDFFFSIISHSPASKMSPIIVSQNIIGFSLLFHVGIYVLIKFVA